MPVLLLLVIIGALVYQSAFRYEVVTDPQHPQVRIQRDHLTGQQMVLGPILAQLGSPTMTAQGSLPTSLAASASVQSGPWTWLNQMPGGNVLVGWIEKVVPLNPQEIQGSASSSEMSASQRPAAASLSTEIMESPQALVKPLVKPLTTIATAGPSIPVPLAVPKGTETSLSPTSLSPTSSAQASPPQGSSQSLPKTVSQGPASVDLNHDGTRERILNQPSAIPGSQDISILSGHLEVFYGQGKALEMLPSETGSGWPHLRLTLANGKTQTYRYHQAQGVYLP